MIKRFTYLSIMILWGCNILVEQTTPLKGDFYIQDGWLAFSSEKYEEADKHFNTSIETNETGSIYHFLSSIGKGWTYMYSAKIKNDSIQWSDDALITTIKPGAKHNIQLYLPLKIKSFTLTPNIILSEQWALDDNMNKINGRKINGTLGVNLQTTLYGI